MRQDNAPGVQRLSRHPICPPTIEPIAEDWPPARAEMHPNLMRASRYQLAADKCQVTGQRPYHFVACFARRAAWRHDDATAIVGVSAKWI